jgi:hypothetical protein
MRDSDSPHTALTRSPGVCSVGIVCLYYPQRRLFARVWVGKKSLENWKAATMTREQEYRREIVSFGRIAGSFSGGTLLKTEFSTKLQAV